MKKAIPFDFVLSELAEASPYIKPMFGCTSVYVEEKIVFILRQRGKPEADDGVWLATTEEHHQSLKKDFPQMRSLEIFGPGPTGWQVLPEDAEDFEETVLKACQFVLEGDPRIGKIPKSKWKKKKSNKKTQKKIQKKIGSKPSQKKVKKKGLRIK